MTELELKEHKELCEAYRDLEARLERSMAAHRRIADQLTANGVSLSFEQKTLLREWERLGKRHKIGSGE